MTTLIAMKLRSVLLIASLALPACYSTRLLRPGEVEPLTARVAPDARMPTWHAAINVLLDDGYVPQVLDATAGYIAARARDDIQNDSLQNTMAIVTIAPDGTVRVQVSGLGQFRSDQDLVTTVQATQHKLFDDIMRAVPPPAPAPAPPSS